VKDTLRNMMLNITRLTQSGKLREATAAIQRALGGSPAMRDMPGGFAPAAPAPSGGDVIDVEARFVDDERRDETPGDARQAEAFAPPEAPPRPPVDEPLWPPAPGLGRFIEGTFGNAAGTRAYKLYEPSGEPSAARPLVVMLHGCKQNPDDFAAGTRMNELAQAQGVVVLYPGQERNANQMGCWNWFKESDQQRDAGEPSIIAEMTRRIVDTYAIDPKRVYIAGLSAGGAMASVMAATYPELYAAVGIHSGLPHAAANSLPSALSAMRHGPAKRANGTPAANNGPAVPTIVFHGDQDKTVHPCNGDQVIAQARWSSAARTDDGAGAGMTVERGEANGGHAFTRTIHRDAEGRCDAEHWLVHGAAHAWSGGSASGSYTDPLGPNASMEMLRFFLEHPKRD